MSQKKNVLVLHSDQLRFNGLSINGAPAGLTPNIDAIADQGFNFTRHISGHPVSMPSRACFFTSLYSGANGVWDNGIPLNRRVYQRPPIQIAEKHTPNFPPNAEPQTMADMFAHAGYRTASFGKLHLTPHLGPAEDGFEESYELWTTGKLDDWHGPYYGFDHVEMTLGHGEFPASLGGHYSNWLRDKHPRLFADIVAQKTHGPRPIENKGDLYASLIPSELHNSMWLADRFCDDLDRMDSDTPFFTFIGFPDPHHPFTPPYDALQAVMDIELPEVYDPDGRTESRPLQQKREKMKLDQQPKTREAVLRYTMAMNYLMDQAVGRIIDKLKSTGQWENTIVLFTADHGDFLGDHGLCYKDRIGCDPLLHVPCVLHVPGAATSQTVTRPMSGVDVMPTLAALAGVDAPPDIHGRDIMQCSDDHLAFSYCFNDLNPVERNFTVYDARYRLTIYPADDYMELFDHEADPAEITNIAEDPGHAAVRARLYDALREAMMHQVNPIAGRLCGF